MADELSQEQPSYEEPIQGSTYETQQEEVAEEQFEQQQFEQEQQLEQEQAELERQAAPVAQAPVPGATQDTAPAPSAGGTGYTPPQPLGMSQGLKEQLSVYLPEEVVNQLASEMQSVADTAAQVALQTRDAQESVAQELGIPAAYIPDVKQHMAMVPPNLRGTKQGAQLAALAGVYSRAETSGDLIGEMQKFVQAARPAPAPQPAPAPRPPARVQPVHPDAQPTRSAIQSTVVRQPVAAGGGNARQNRFDEDLARHFPGIAKMMEEEL